MNFRPGFWEFWGTSKAVLEVYRLQGLPKLKVSACWRSVMLYRHISDKPAVWFHSVAPVISMEMSWGVVALPSPPKKTYPSIPGDCIYANMGSSGWWFFSPLYLISSLCCFFLHFFLMCSYQHTWEPQRLLSDLFLQYRHQLLSNCTWKWIQADLDPWFYCNSLHVEKCGVQRDSQAEL